MTGQRQRDGAIPERARGREERRREQNHVAVLLQVGRIVTIDVLLSDRDPVRVCWSKKQGLWVRSAQKETAGYARIWSPWCADEIRGTAWPYAHITAARLGLTSAPQCTWF